MPAAGRLGDQSQCPNDSHGCPGCPHSVIGPATTGSPNVRINGKAALRVGDKGTHSSCCGGNTWEAVQGAPGVRINGKAAHRKGDMDHHCGGTGKLVDGSPNVYVGNFAASAEARTQSAAPPEKIVWVRVVDQWQQALAGVIAHIESASGSTRITRRTDPHGYVRAPVHEEGEYHVKIGPEHAHPQDAAVHATGGTQAQTQTPAAVQHVKIGTTQAQPLTQARPTIHPLGWEIQIETPVPGAKYHIEPGRFDATNDKDDTPTPPPMPKLRVKARVFFTHDGHRDEVRDGKVVWDFRIKGKYRVRAHGEPRGFRLQPYDLPGGRFASASDELIEVTLAPAEVVGGDVEVYVQYQAGENSPHAGIKVADVQPCGEILGRNPDRRDLFAFIIAQAEFRRARHARQGHDYGNLAWLFFRLFQHESSQHQFNPPNPSPRAAGYSEKPNYGDPAGVGIGQRDAEESEWHFKPGGPSANLAFTNELWPRIFWNWKENVIAGIEVFYGKLAVAQAALYGWATRVRKSHPHDHVPDPPDGAVIREALRRYNGGSEYQLVEGTGGWRWVKAPMLGSSPYPTSSANYHYPDQVLDVDRSDPGCVPAGNEYAVPASVR